MNDRTPSPARPMQNVRAEEAVIGKIIGSADAFWSVAGILKAEHFTVPYHRDIFTAVAICCETSSGPTLSLLESKLPVEWEGVGDVEAVLQILMEKAKDVSSPSDFTDDIVEAWKEREKLAIAKLAAQPKPFAEVRGDIEARYKAIDDADRAQHAIPIGDASATALKRTAEAYENQGKRVVGIHTGIKEFDDAIGPMIGGTLFTLGAPSGHGKSALAAQIMRNNAAQSLDISRVTASGFISMEMSEAQNGYRNLASMTGISIRKQIRGDLSSRQFEELQRAQRQLEQMPIYIQSKGRMTARQVGNECRLLARRYGVRLFVIDHLRLYEPEKEHWTEVRTIEHATAYNKDLAKELDAVVIQLAQLTQESQKTGNWRFKDSSFYGGGMVKANSDIMLGVAIPLEWLQQNQPEPPQGDERSPTRIAHDQWMSQMSQWRDKAEFVTFKVRDGQTGVWKPIDFDGPRMLFGEAPSQDQIPF